MMGTVFTEDGNMLYLNINCHVGTFKQTFKKKEIFELNHNLKRKKIVQ